jgi:aspartyl-tRNA(Asn)/glutamyl-tRNA(Gln) amidotransferase subunit C
MSEIDNNTVLKVARLSRLRTSEAEAAKIAPELNGILTWVEQLGEVNTDNVEPLPSPVDITLHQREDIVNDGDCQEDVLANAYETLEGFYVVPKVVE